jgi:transcriptional regulator with XRE-family HTH domain
MTADIRARFGERIRKLRKKRALTLIELGEYLGLDRGYLGDLERGKRDPSLTTLQHIARGFGLTISKLLSGL